MQKIIVLGAIAALTTSFFSFAGAGMASNITKPAASTQKKIVRSQGKKLLVASKPANTSQKPQTKAGCDKVKTGKKAVSCAKKSSPKTAKSKAGKSAIKTESKGTTSK